MSDKKEFQPQKLDESDYKKSEHKAKIVRRLGVLATMTVGILGFIRKTDDEELKNFSSKVQKNLFKK